MSVPVLERSERIWRSVALRACSGLRIGPITQQQQRHADQHDQAELDRGAEQDRGDEEERDDRAGEAGGHVHHVADVVEVGGADRDHLAGADLARQRAAEAHRLAGRELHDPVGRGQPVGDREAVPHDPGDRLEQADQEHHAGPEQQLLLVLVGHAAVDRATQHRGHHGLARHPHDAERHAAGQGRQLLPGEPPQEPAGGAMVRGSGIGDRQCSHWPDPRFGTVLRRMVIARGRPPPRRPAGRPAAGPGPAAWSGVRRCR